MHRISRKNGSDAGNQLGVGGIDIEEKIHNTSRQHIVRWCTENVNDASSRIWLYFIDAMF
jgi:hypothetical protein